MDLGIKGRKALVCAASRGLGRACAFSLAREGAALTIVARRAGPLAETAREIRDATGATVTTVEADLSTEEGRDKALASCSDPDILVTNNGGPPHINDFRKIDHDTWLQIFDRNMLSAIFMVRGVIDGMIARRFGRIVNVTSIVVKAPGGALEMSSGPRLGLTGFMSGLARQVAQHNVTINFLLPGSFDTDRVHENMTIRARNWGVEIEEAYRRSAAGSPANRIADPGEFGDACAFLCSAQAGYITGQNLLMDGGRYPGTF